MAKQICWSIPSRTRLPSKPAEAAPADRYVTAEQFRDRFTGAELAAILAAQQTDAQIAQFLYLVATATGPFSLDDPRVVAGLPYLVSKGLIAANRPENPRMTTSSSWRPNLSGVQRTRREVLRPDVSLSASVLCA